MYDNIRTVYIDLPTTIKAYTIVKDDFYTIVINSKLSSVGIQKAFKHEMKHITDGDFYKGTPVGIMEIYAHEIT